MPPDTIDYNTAFYRMRACLEAEAGLKWQKYFNERRRRIQLGVYYDFSYWIDQNMMLNQQINIDFTTSNAFVTNISKFGDLQIQGIRVSAEIDF